MLLFDIGNTTTKTCVISQSGALTSQHTFLTREFQVPLVPSVKRIGIVSVVASQEEAIKRDIAKIYDFEPEFLKPSSCTKICDLYETLGSDRLANMLGALRLFPGKDIITVSMGTATTIEVVTKDRRYLGGMIVSGIQTALSGLLNRGDQLQDLKLNILSRPISILSRNTNMNLASGAYFVNLYGLKRILDEIKHDFFPNGSTIVGTGGFAETYKDESLFDVINRNLVFEGMREAFNL
jgi:type III pantothenate kinase